MINRNEPFKVNDRVSMITCKATSRACCFFGVLAIFITFIGFELNSSLSAQPSNRCFAFSIPYKVWDANNFPHESVVYNSRCRIAFFSIKKVFLNA